TAMRSSASNRSFAGKTIPDRFPRPDLQFRSGGRVSPRQGDVCGTFGCRWLVRRSGPEPHLIARSTTWPTTTFSTTRTPETGARSEQEPRAPPAGSTPNRLHTTRHVDLPSEAEAARAGTTARTTTRYATRTRLARRTRTRRRADLHSCC